MNALLGTPRDAMRTPDEAEPKGVLAFLPNPSGLVRCIGTDDAGDCGRPAHWVFISWEGVDDPEGDLLIARAVLCRAHLSSTLAGVELVESGSESAETSL